MKAKYIVLLLGILFITGIGYTIQTISEPYVEQFPIEEVVEKIDYKPEIQPILTNFSNYLESRFNETNSVGGAVAIVYKGQVVMLQPYGVKKVGTIDSVNIHTIFRLASVSKGFAGVLAGMLAEKGIINLDTTITSYIPNFKLKRKANTNNVTLRNILGHTSGVVAHSFDPVIEDGISYNQLFNMLDEANICAQPGKKYKYQNAIFSIFDSVAHKQTSYTYQELLHDSIFAPLGMDDASVELEGFTSCDNYAYPHKRKRRGFSPTPLNDRYYNVPSAAGVNASINDLSIWLQALLGYRDSVISRNVISEISTPHVKTPIKRINRATWGNIENKYYGMGWRIIQTKENTIIYHGGFVEGYRAEIAFCKEKEIGIAFLLNSPNILASEVAPRFMREFFDYQDSIQSIPKEELISLNLPKK